MAGNEPVWLATMRNIVGTKWNSGDPPSQNITSWLQFIANKFPVTSGYCGAAAHQEYFAWCGLTVAYCMATANIAPVFGTTDTEKFLWAEAWLQFGDGVDYKIAAPQPGDIVIFDFSANDQHVTLFLADTGNGHWSCLGGNQGHEVKESSFPSSAVMGVRRPNAAAKAEVAIAPGAAAASAQFQKCVKLVLASEGGNVDDPHDPGGRTSRGITQGDWDSWRLSRPGLPADVFLAPPDQIEAIYQTRYWNAVRGDKLPIGVDYAVFDCGVLNGVGATIRILQGALGVDVDGDIGPTTLGACNNANRASLINKICDARLTRMQALATWPIYGTGWTSRIKHVREDALAMIGAVVPVTQSKETSVPTVGQSSDSPTSDTLTQAIQQVLVLFQTLQKNAGSPVGASTSPASDQVKQFIGLLQNLIGAGPDKQPLGPVNAALGQTIGDLLNGKKSAIGIIGALITSIFSNIGGADTLGILGKLVTAAGGSGTFLPIFLAIAAWGFLGKLEKWSGSSPNSSK